MTIEDNDILIKAIKELDALPNEVKVNLRGKYYTQVHHRVEAFRKHFGLSYGYETEIAPFLNGVIATTRIRKIGQTDVIGSGSAYASNISKEKCLEKLETTSVGRALAAFGLSGGEYASEYEMNSFDDRYEQEPQVESKPKPTPEQQIKIDWIEKELAKIANLETAQAVTKHISEKAFTDVQSTLSDKQKKYVNYKISNRISQLSQQPLEEGVAAE